MAGRLTGPPAAVLVDLDGTLLDSEPVWSQVVGAVAREHGAPWTADDDLAVVGWSVPALCTELVGRGVPLGAPELTGLLHARVGAQLLDDPPWRPGAQALLAGLRDAGVPSALVTATGTDLAEQLVAAAPAGSLRLVVGGDQVVEPKPAPEGYLLAARLLGVDASACVVLEDSPTGVRAGLASGARVVAVDPAQRMPADVATHPRLRRRDGLPPVPELLD